MSARIVHLAPTATLRGTAALCGYILTGEEPHADDSACARCREIEDAPQPDALLATIRDHVHSWVSAGVAGRGDHYSPAYECSVCGEVVKDLRIQRKAVLP
jgi:rubredoxin